MSNQQIYEYEPISNDRLMLFLSLNLLPDIKRKIYEEYFKQVIVYNKKYMVLMQQVNSSECQRLNSTNLLGMVRSVVEHPNFCKFVRHKNELFSKLYREHFIENKKYFVLMNQMESLTMSWLMYLYH
jgi:hypothetical protein